MLVQLKSREPDVDVDVPPEEQSEIFPRLSPEMADRVVLYGETQFLPKGTLVFERGQRAVDFFMVLDGVIEIFDSDTKGRTNVFTTHSERQFTGEIDMFTDREILVSGRTGVDSKVVRIRHPQFNRLVTGEPDIGEIIMRAFIARRLGLIEKAHGGVVLLGPAHDAETIRLQRFLMRNNYPHRLLDTESDAETEGFLKCFELTPDQLPVVILPDRRVFRSPTTAALADALGVMEAIDPAHVYNVAIVGAGPAGLAAAVYAASEGLDTIVIESLAPGGQAGTSSRIENYLGFPTGVSGQELAGRAQIQAQKFGTKLVVSRSARGIACDETPLRLLLDDGQSVATCAVIVATGARYRKLDVPNYDRFEGAGIHYAATAMEAKLCTGEDVVVVGGGNSAGQAALFLSRATNHVHLVVRADGLAATMSDYLVQRIGQSSRITLYTHTQVTNLTGEQRLAQVTLENSETGESRTLAAANMFVMIGAEPNTEWLDGCLPLDAKGFVITGKDNAGMALDSAYATTKPGIFAVGDVRSGSVKRVASGVGEGSAVVQAVHQFLNPGVA